MTTAGTAYVKIAFAPGSVKQMTTSLAEDLRKFADYLDAYDPDADEDADQA